MDEKYQIPILFFCRNFAQFLEKGERMKKKNMLTALLCLAMMVPAMAEERTMGLQELFSLAEQNSRSIAAHKADVQVQEAGVKTAKSNRLPDIAAQVSVSYLGNGFLMDRDFSNGHSISMPHYGNNFALQVSQAIFTGGALSSGIEMAELGKQLSELSLENDVQKIHYLLTGYYLDIFRLMNQEKVLTEDIELTDKLIENINQRYDQGTALKNDITRYELRKQSLLLKREEIINSRKIVNRQLVNVLGLSQDTEIIPEQSIINQAMDSGSEAEWQQLAIANSPALQITNAKVAMSRQELRMAKSELYPKIAVIAHENMDGPITIEVPTLNNNFNYWYVGLGVSYNLSSLFKSNHKVNQKKVAINQREIEHEQMSQNLNNGVQAAYVQLTQAETELKTYQKSLQLANENYEVVESRYTNALALLTDMLDASTQRLQAELDVVNARINRIYRYYSLKYACGDI